MLISTRTYRPSTRNLSITLAGLCFLGYADCSLTLQQTFQTTGFDLGIFEQAVRSYAAGHWPVADLKAPGFPLLGDHFHPILALLAPVYRVWPGADTLLLAQAALLAASVIPVVRVACAVLGPVAGAAVGVGYGLSWGLVNALVFDFHEVCFAVPLLAFALERVLAGRAGAAVLVALPLVLVKEDLPLTLAAIGVVLALGGRRRLGWTVAAFGVLTCALLMLVVLPAINPAHGYAYWAEFGGRASPLTGLGRKLLTTLLVLAPTGLLALRSPLVLIAVPSLLGRFVAANPYYWGTGFHYSAVLMPIVFLAGLDGYRRCRPRRGYLPACALAMALVAVLVLRSGPTQPAWTPAEQATARQVLAVIPDGATVAAANRLAPQLTARCDVYSVPWYPAGDQRPDWVVLTRPSTQAAALLRAGYRVVLDTDPVLLLERAPVRSSR